MGRRAAVLAALLMVPVQPVATWQRWATGDGVRCIRACESSGCVGDGNYTQAGGLSPEGGAYQFELASWYAVGGQGLPADATSSAQDQAAYRLWQWQGWAAWPNTSVLCGLR